MIKAVVKRLLVAFLIMGGLSCFCVCASAENIVLKSGVEIEAEIIERNDDYIRINFQGTPVTYNIYEIKSIGAEDLTAPARFEQPASEGKLVYRSPYFKFSINYPAEWQMQELGPIVAFKSPREDARDDFQENVIVAVENTGAPPMDMEQYREFFLKEARKNLPDFKLIKQTDTDFAGRKACLTIYSARAYNTVMKGRVIRFIDGNLAYNLTYSASEDSFDKYLPQAEAIIGSFRLGN